MKQRPLSRKRAAIYARRQHPLKWTISRKINYILREKTAKTIREILRRFPIPTQMLGAVNEHP